MERSRRLTLLAAATPFLVGATGFLACSGERTTDAGDSLRRDFPTRASEALVARRHFERTAGGLRASASHGFDVVLPDAGDGAIVFETSEGAVIRLREEHASGTATHVESSIRYDRPGGHTYWSLRDAGIEEWIALEPDAVVADAPAVTWSVEGGRFAQIEDAIAVVDGAGRAMLRVAAPVAYGVDGREIDVDLRLAGDRLALHVDADGERVLVDPFWFDAGDMNVPRSGHVALQLFDGRVLVAGGTDASGLPTSMTEVYDPDTHIWLTRSPLPGPVELPAIAPLPSGDVLVAGGVNDGPVSSAQLYDPGADSWTPISEGMNAARSGHTATALFDGRVLISGGGEEVDEIFDPADGGFSLAGGEPFFRIDHVAVLLEDGRVLLAGGESGSPIVEIYDPFVDDYVVAASMNQGRTRFGAAPLPDGRILVSGGSPIDLTSAEIYDPNTDVWTPAAPMNTPRIRHTLIPLPDGRTLAVGGAIDFSEMVETSSVEVYDPFSDVWTEVDPLEEGRLGHTTTPLPDGTVLAAGGATGSFVRLGSAERFTLLGDLGETCQLDFECASGFCAGDVCCNEACDDECRTCDNDGTGICIDRQDDESCSLGTCQGGTCVPAGLPDGDPCTNGQECLSGNCFDDVCCNTFCFGDCEACSIAAGADEDGVCAPTPGVICDNPFNCSDDDVCSAEGFCEAAQEACPVTECLEDNFCDGKANACAETPLGDGTPCSSGGTCQSGVCIPPELLEDGAACESGAQCESANCVDDVCCNTTCNGACVACSIQAGADEDGTCGPVDDGTSCGKGGTCEAGVCSVLLPNGEACELESQCESGNCVDDVCCNTACIGECVACDGASDGTCQPVADGTTCEGGSCQAGLCVLDQPKADGEPCEDAEECESGQCVDDVCCDTACDGDCDACSIEAGAAADGTCGNAAGRSCDDGSACTQTDTCQDRACVGSDPVTCTPVACQVSSTCSDSTGLCVPVSLPDGAPCDGGVCIAGACQTDPDVGSLSGSGTGNPSGAGPGGTESAGPGGTASGPSGGTGAGAGSGSGDDEDGAADGDDGGCTVGSGSGPTDLAWLAIAGLVLSRWRRREPVGPAEGRRARP